tara:strand:+ start:258 stop:1196 length:939 start_codon:yes stop_codon:yes gene_type:complete
MAVNYGLGGFKNGAAYAYGFVNSAFEVTIGADNKYFGFTESMNLSTYLLAEETSAGVIQLHLAGYYFIKYSVTTSGASGDNLQLGILVNGNNIAGGAQYLYSNNGDEFTTNSSTITEISGSISTIQLAIQNISNATDVTIESYNISIIRVGDLNTQSDLFLAGTSFLSTTFNSIASPDTIAYAATDTFYPINSAVNTLVSSQNMKSDDKFNTLEIVMDGFYMLDASITTEGSSNDNLVLGILKNGSDDAAALDYPMQAYNSKGGTFWQTGVNAIFELKTGDFLMLALQNKSDTTGTTKVVSINKNLSRIGNI